MRYQLQFTGVAAAMIDAIRWTHTHNTQFFLRISYAGFVATISTAQRREKTISLDGRSLSTFMRN